VTLDIGDVRYNPSIVARYCTPRSDTHQHTFSSDPALTLTSLTRSRTDTTVPHGADICMCFRVQGSYGSCKVWDLKVTFSRPGKSIFQA